MVHIFVLTASVWCKKIKGLRACWFLCQGGSPEPPSRTDCRQESNNTAAWRQAISCEIVFALNRVSSRLEGYPELTCISAALSKLDRQPSTVEAVCGVIELVRLATYSAIQRRKSVFPCISHGDRCPTIPPTSPTSSPIALIGSHPLAFPEHAVKIPFETSCFRGGTSSELSRFSPALCSSASRSCTGTRHVSNSRISSYSSLSLSPETSFCMGAQGEILDGWRNWNVYQLPSCFPGRSSEAHRTLQLLLFLNCWCFRFLIWKRRRRAACNFCCHQQRTNAVYQHARVCPTCRQNYCRSSPLSFCGDVSSGKKAAPTPRWHSCLQ